MCFKADAFTHTMRVICRSEKESGSVEEEGGSRIGKVLMSIVGSGRGSLKGGSGIFTLLGGSI